LCTHLLYIRSQFHFSQQIAQIKVCAICSQFEHTTETCPMSSSTDQEQANYVGQNNYPPKNNPYSNTSWSNNQNVQNPQGKQRNFQQGNNYQASPQAVQPNPKRKKNYLESALLQFMTAQQQSNTQTSQDIQKLEATTSQAIQRLET
jgi:hypothetical protein